MIRQTAKGTEVLISKTGDIEIWSLVQPTQEFLDKNREASIAQANEERKNEILCQIKALEEKIFYSMLEGDESFIAQKKAQREALKAEWRAL